MLDLIMDPQVTPFSALFFCSGFPRNRMAELAKR
jgi:hypothetical protein